MKWSFIFFDRQAKIDFNSQSFNEYEEVPRISNEDEAENDEAPPPPPARGSSLVTTSPIVNEDSTESDKNDINIDHEERPLPPLPSREHSLGPVDEANGSDSADMVDEDSSDDMISDNDDSDIDNTSTNQNNVNTDANESSMLVNGNHESDECFDANATLPPSPSKSANTYSGGTEPNSVSNSSFESALYPDSER